jgi:hypothetical protein
LTTDLKANHSGISSPLRSICLNLVPAGEKQHLRALQN